MGAEQQELENLRKQLAEANATLDAIRSGGVDALVVGQGEDHEVYTLQSADLPYRDFLEQMAQGALSLSTQHEVLYCNEFICSILGVARDAIQGVPIFRWLDAPSRSTLLEAIDLGQSSTVAATFIHSSGEDIPVVLSIVPSRAGRSRRTNIVVTDERADRHLKQVTRAHHAAKAESDAKDRFLAVLGHELRNPLAALSNSVAVLVDVPLDLDQQKNIHVGMARHVQQLNSLVDDLLDMTRIAQGKVVLKPEPLELAEVVADAVASVEQMAASKHQRLRVDVPGGLSVHADRVRLEQVLINLLTNASRYTPAEGNISVDATTSGGIIEINVTDTGIGIAEDDLERIFEPFSQLGPEGTGGLGIGLSLVRQLVHLHQGTVAAHSPGANAGTRFTLTLPILQQNSRAAPPPVRAEEPKQAPDSARPRRILIVDDNSDAAELMSLMLTKRGHSVSAVFRGKDVLPEVNSFHPEVVLLDLGLPDITGYDVARELRGAGHVDLKIVALTGFSHESARVRAREAGFDAHLVKPVGMDQLVEVLSRANASEPAEAGSLGTT